MITIPRPLFFVLLACLLTHSLAAASGVRIISLEPTVLFPKREPLAQVARLTVVNNSGAPVACEAVVSVAGGARETVAGLTLAANQSTIDVLVPDLTAPAKVNVELISQGVTVAVHEQDWQPQRKWKVYLVKSSHEDIGYENYIFKKQHDIANFIDLGREQSSPKSVAGNIGSRTAVMKESPFHYTMESILFQRNYIEERGEAAWRNIVEKDLKPGHMSLEGAPSGVHSHWMDYEELARMTYPARRETRDRFGLDLKTFMIVDNPSLSWSGMQAVADAGFKYVARWGQSWRSGGNNDYATTKVPAIFWWQGPDGVSKVLYSWRSHYSNGFWYGQTSSYSNLVELGAANVSGFLREVESGSVLGPYPYDALVTPEYIDHDIPRFDMRMLPAWHEKYSYPTITVAGPESFFEYIEKKYGDSLPVLHGDLNNFSADYASIDPVSQGWKREAARLLPAAEGLGVVAGTMNPGFALLPAEVERTYTRMFDYDEHCWPTLPRATDEQLFNASWVKNHEARRALEHAQSLFAQSAGELVKNIAGQGEGVLVVFNSLVHPRTDVVTASGTAATVTDLHTGRSIPCAPAGEGKFSFVATDVPAFGYALFRIESATPAAAVPELQADAASISNSFYTVRFNATDGTVASIVDKSNGRELIDASAPYRANQLVYVHKNTRESKEGFEYSPLKTLRTASRVEGAKAEFEVWIDDAKLGGKIHQTVTLHAGVKRIDFVNKLESIDVMWGAKYEDRYCDNLYYAFPFAVKDGQIRAEYPGGVVRPYDDQLRWGSHDYLYANRWIDVSNATGGVTLASREAGTFSLGEIRYNEFDVNYKPTKPWLFNYAWSNRMAGLLTLNPDDCNASFHYSITSHDGNWNSGAAVQLGWQAGSPLLALPVPPDGKGAWTVKQQGFLTVDASNVQLTVLKTSGQAGRGWIARLVETDGRTTECELDASALGVTDASLCNLVEDDGKPLAVKGGKVRVPIPSFGFATVRLVAGAKPAATGAVVTSEVTDSTVGLQWAAPSTGEVGYNIYRSDDPDAPATVYTIVGRTRDPAFTDAGLSPATHYYYRVSAVTAANIEGPLSPKLVVQTSAENTSPPSPVHELGVVRRAGDTLIVYWRKNPETDVARFEVYRGETPDFKPGDGQPVAVLPVSGYFLEIFRDTGLQPGQTYYYRVLPVDWSDHRQTESPVAGATTPSDPS